MIWGHEESAKVFEKFPIAPATQVRILEFRCLISGMVTHRQA
jgi:hypothetical protein